MKRALAASALERNRIMRGEGVDPSHPNRLDQSPLRPFYTLSWNSPLTSWKLNARLMP